MSVYFPASAILETLSDGFQAFDREWRYVYLNARAERLLGRKRDDLLGRVCWEEYPEAVGTPFHDRYVRAMETGEPDTFEDVCPHDNSWVEFSLHPSANGLVAYQRDITERKRAELLVAGQNRIFERIATGVPLEESLEAIVRLIEEQAPRVICSVCLVSDDNSLLRLGAGPSIPTEYARTMGEGFPIGPNIGSCGAAAYHKHPVYADIATDPNWEKVRDLPLANGLRACWSTPIIGSDGGVLGTFGLFYDEARPVLPHEEQLVAAAIHMAQIAIERDRAETRRRSFIREMLAILTERRFQLCLAYTDLPEPLPVLCDPMALSLSSLRLFRQQVATAAESVGMDIERGYSIVTAADEAASNAVKHANGGTGVIRGDLATGQLQIWIHDNGPGIEETSLHRALMERGFSTAGTLGHGFFLMPRLCDRTFVLTGPGGTVVVLEQDRTPPPPPWMQTT